MEQKDSVGSNMSRWTGKKFQKLIIEGYLIPWSPISNQPLFVQVGGCEDWFLPIFSTEEKLHAHMAYLHERGMLPLPVSVGQIGPQVLEVLGHSPYKIKKIDPGGQTEFLESVFAGGVRVMVDPRIISDNHTKWTEVVWEGDEFKLMSDGG